MLEIGTPHNNYLKVSDIFENPRGSGDGDVINQSIREIISKGGYCIIDLSDTTCGVGASFLQATVKGLDPEKIVVSKTTDGFYYKKLCEYMDYRLKVSSVVKCKECKHLVLWGDSSSTTIHGCALKMQGLRIFDPVEGEYKWPSEVNKAFIADCRFERQDSTGFFGFFIDKKRCGIDGKNFEPKVTE